MSTERLSPLNSSWDLWHTPNITPELSQKYGSWEKANLALTEKIDSIKTVEGFWAAFSALPGSTKLPKDEYVFWFRDGIAPKWEDPGFKGDGAGRFLIKLDLATTADKYIQSLLVHVLGEQVTVDTGIVGLVGGVRYGKKDSKRDQFVRVELWTTTHDKEDKLKKLLLELAKADDIDNLDRMDNLSFQPFNKGK